jgi:hypothetical protein
MGAPAGNTPRQQPDERIEQRSCAVDQNGKQWENLQDSARQQHLSEHHQLLLLLNCCQHLLQRAQLLNIPLLHSAQKRAQQ